jgi:hypothetical protein
VVAPFFLGLARHGRRGWVLDFEPMRRTPRSVERAEPLGHNALAPESPGVSKDDFAVALVMLTERDAGMRATHQLPRGHRRW